MRHTLKKYFKINYFCFCIIILQTNTWADQYFTEDPEPVEYGHIEFIPFASVNRINIYTFIEAPAFEINFGVYEDLEAHLIVPAAVNIPRSGSSQYGYSDIEAGFKYRFVQETETLPAIAFYPKVLLPVGDRKLGLGYGGAIEQFPLWLEKNWDSWKLSGGGGYATTQAPQTTNYWFGGVVLQKEVLPKELTFGGELYAQGNIGQGVKKSLILTLGANYNFTPDYAFVCSVGHSIAGQNTLTGYIGFDFLLGPSDCTK
jgi:hypothetical protein